MEPKQFEIKSIDCKADFPIFQINNRVFQISNINNISFLQNFPNLVFEISNILNLGLNFIPRYFHNKLDFFSSLFDNFNTFLVDFNKKFIFYHSKFSNSNYIDKSFKDPSFDEEPTILDVVFKKLMNHRKASTIVEYPLTSATIDMEFEFYRAKKQTIRDPLSTVFHTLLQV